MPNIHKSEKMFVGCPCSTRPALTHSLTHSLCTSCLGSFSTTISNAILFHYCMHRSPKVHSLHFSFLITINLIFFNFQNMPSLPLKFGQHMKNERPRCYCKMDLIYIYICPPRGNLLKQYVLNNIYLIYHKYFENYNHSCIIDTQKR